MRKVSSILLLLTLCGVMSSAQADWGSIFRSITGSLGGNSGSERSANTGVATIGSRGYLGEDLKSANPDPNAQKSLDKWKATPQEATAEAKKSRLVARDVQPGSGGSGSSNNAPANASEVQP